MNPTPSVLPPLDDTIIAVSTPVGRGGLGIVRLSGKQAMAIAKRMVRLKSKKGFPRRKPVLGGLICMKTGEVFDEVLITLFPGPHTYTCEDMAEISCHGSPVVIEEAIRQGRLAGARHALPGEFTYRAFVNGRLDIIQAEAVNDLVEASSLTQAKISYLQIKGELSKTIQTFRHEVIRCLALIEASIEFPDESLNVNSSKIINNLENLHRSITKLIRSYDLGKSLTKGISIAIMGRPNVGKSTLFNALLGSNRAIVTPYPGTTRDYIQEEIAIQDSRFVLIDTAGYGYSDHPIEKEGIHRGKSAAERADGILVLIDSSQKETDLDFQLLKRWKKKNMAVVFNKADLPSHVNKNRIRSSVPGHRSVSISALKKTHLDRLKKLMYAEFIPESPSNKEVILHLHQKIYLEEIALRIRTALNHLTNKMSEEFAAEELRDCLPAIGKLFGEIEAEDIFKTIFNQFCIGK